MPTMGAAISIERASLMKDKIGRSFSGKSRTDAENLYNLLRDSTDNGHWINTILLLVIGAGLIFYYFTQLQPHQGIHAPMPLWLPVLWWMATGLFHWWFSRIKRICREEVARLVKENPLYWGEMKGKLNQLIQEAEYEMIYGQRSEKNRANQDPFGL